MRPCYFSYSESIAECKDRGEELYILALDVQKAFDVVRHNSLLDKLYEQGMVGLWWKLKESAYRNLKECILWDGNLSKPYEIQQGSRKRALPSPDDYKSYINKALTNLTNSSKGFMIGNVDITVPTCADDIILLSTNPTELQFFYQKLQHMQIRNIIPYTHRKILSSLSILSLKII